VKRFLYVKGTDMVIVQNLEVISDNFRVVEISKGISY